MLIELALAQTFTRLDQLTQEPIKLQAPIHLLVISENCIPCKKQISLMKSCQLNLPTAILIEGSHEARLRKLVKRYDSQFPTYWIDRDFKVKYQLSDSTPAHYYFHENNLKKKMIGYVAKCQDLEWSPEQLNR